LGNIFGKDPNLLKQCRVYGLREKFSKLCLSAAKKTKLRGAKNGVVF
jgi:hypothetical protein